MDRTLCATSKVSNLTQSEQALFLVQVGAKFVECEVIVSSTNAIDIDGFKNPILQNPGARTEMQESRPDDRNDTAYDVKFYDVPEEDVISFGGTIWPCAREYIPSAKYRAEKERMVLLQNTNHLMRVRPDIGAGLCTVFVRFKIHE